MNNYKNIETTCKDLPNILKNADSNLKIKITDPENVVLGYHGIYGTLGYLINNYTGAYLVDFTPSDFSTAIYTANSTYLFNGCTKLSGMCKLPSSITNASKMFANCTGLTSIDTSGFTNVTNTGYMFTGCTNLTSIDTSTFTKVTSAYCMFWGCTNLKSIDTSGFTNVTNADYMFQNCTGLTSIDTTAFTNVTNANNMFFNCTNLKNIDMSGFENIETADEMFFNCENLSSINPLFGINLKNLKSYNNMFEGCQKIY